VSEEGNSISQVTNLAEVCMSKVWFITGSGNGLGRDIAEAALAAGDSVVAGSASDRRAGTSGSAVRLLLANQHLSGWWQFYPALDTRALPAVEVSGNASTYVTSLSILAVGTENSVRSENTDVLQVSGWLGGDVKESRNCLGSA
jgi:NAD(P)-dependent dehydrogenase (short-subunit alcohol dehydrogenase family)